MVASGKCLKSIVGVKKPEKDDQGGKGFQKEVIIELLETSECSSTADAFNAAVATIVRAPPKNFRVVRQEWAAIRIQTAFRGFLIDGWLDYDGMCVVEARRALRALEGVMRLQALVRGRQAVQKLLSDCRNKEDMLKQVEEGWCDSQGTLHEIRTKVQMRQEGAVKNFYVNHFVAECLSNKNGAVLD
ncbi:hypothetical protein IFM89_030681 [Coptis chinensis]|uniref:Uncharacterized protein n=1 Tax=Coptis chinensis TaxID=261450 RepID=A0A835IZ05_9MAGN|nr:hypothetical protein IFM89_030681 [Coptis chinensis]